MTKNKSFLTFFLNLFLPILISIYGTQAQVICVMCYDQNDSISDNVNNRLLNGGFENTNCIPNAWFSSSFCPSSNYFNCNISNWNCTGGGTSTYADVTDTNYSQIAEGIKAVYFGSWYCRTCSNSTTDTSCLVKAGCTTRGVPAGYPNNDSNYGGVTGLNLKQTVNGLVPGNVYVLEFWSGGEGDAFSFPEDGLFAVDVGFGDTLLRCPPTSPNGIGRRFIIEFIATSASHTIKFTNWGHICSNCTELILDNVRLYTLAELNPVVPACFINQNPVVNIASSDSTWCDKKAIDFYDMSTNNPTSWHWYFPGAFPNSSLVQNPTGIYYANPGVFPVTLVACNSFGCDSVTFNAFINELTAPLPPPIFINGDTLCTSVYPSYEWYDESDSLFVLSTNQCYVPVDTGKYFVFVTDLNGCEIASPSIIINSIKEYVNNFSSLILPNPFTNEFLVTVNNNDETQLILYDVTSRVLLLKKFIQSLNVDVQNFSKGIYFYELKNKRGILKKGKLVKE